MAYTKFYDPALDDDLSTPVDAAWANHVETGIFDAAAVADQAETDAQTALAAANASAKLALVVALS